MTIEQKAKAYDEAVARAREIHRNEDDKVKDMEWLFPELAESEDEEVRKALINALNNNLGNGIEKYGTTLEKALNWLEKQGEQDNWAEELNTKIKELNKQCIEIIQKYVSPCDGCNNYKGCVDCVEGDQWAKITEESKFKVGDWVIDKESKEVFYIRKNLANTYEIVDIEGNDYHVPHYTLEEDYDVWTIANAKDGDVLVIQKTDVTYESIFIFNKIENNRIIQHLHYLTTDADEKVCEARSIDGFIGFVGATVHPATKEQRELLFKKMKEAGWSWNPDEKKLEKIEQKTWSEEDEKMLDSIIVEVSYIGDFPDYPTKLDCELKDESDAKIKWLKSLKDRVQPKKEWKQENVEELSDFENAMMHIGGSFFGENAGLDPNDTNAIKEQANLLLELVPSKEWSEKDESFIKDLLNYFGNLVPLKHEMDDVVDWLETLKEKFTCPSDELMEIIDSLRHKWSLGDSTESKYKVEAYDELIEMLNEEKQ